MYIDVYQGTTGPYESEIRKLRKAFYEADAVIVGAGAGLSTSAFLPSVPVWHTGEELAFVFQRPQGINAATGTIRLERGTLTYPQLKAILDKLPVDLTFIYENDMNRYFLDNGRIFMRPSTALDRPVKDCHPPRVQIAIVNLLKDFKSGKRDHMEIWSEHPFPVHVHYLALHDDNGRYIGALEIVQKCDEIASHFCKTK